MYNQMKKQLEENSLREYQHRADELGITLQEYLSFLILKKLDDLSVVAYVERT